MDFSSALNVLLFSLQPLEGWSQPIISLLVAPSSPTSSFTLANFMSAFIVLTNLFLGELAALLSRMKRYIFSRISITGPAPELNTSLKQLGIMHVGNLPAYRKQAIILSGSLGLLKIGFKSQWASLRKY